MAKNITSLFTYIFIYLFFTSTLSAKISVPYKHILVGGASIPIDGGDGSVTPIVQYHFIKTDFKNPELFLRTLLSQSESYILFEHERKHVHGMRFWFGYFNKGGNNFYIDGDKLDTEIFHANAAGIEIFTEFKFLQELMKFKLTYFPKYFFYINRGETTIQLPSDHFENQFSLKLEVSRLEKKYSDLIRHGFLFRLENRYHLRHDYDFVEDTRDNPHMYKSYLTLGYYHNFEKDINIQYDFFASYQYNLDRNNGEKVGGSTAPHAKLPGYYRGEFYSDKYLGSRLALAFRASKLHILNFYTAWVLMPKNTAVQGVPDFRRNLYGSAGLIWNMSFLGFIPVRIMYGLGINAKRDRDTLGHEVRVLMILGFGKYNKQSKRQRNL